ncbi:hypothetical protein ACGFIR_24805 [Micromonospora sp. NPDC049051]|uniref:hypothetical protein n=1 Tax=Micromonospora sp. NPDC049051 TaxID=3364264 RepID=UPI003714FB66
MVGGDDDHAGGGVAIAAEGVSAAPGRGVEEGGGFELLGGDLGGFLVGEVVEVGACRLEGPGGSGACRWCGVIGPSGW